MPLLRGEHVEEECVSLRKFTAAMLHLRNDFALLANPLAALGYEPLSFGWALPCALAVHTPEHRRELAILFPAFAP